MTSADRAQTGELRADRQPPGVLQAAGLAASLAASQTAGLTASLTAGSRPAWTEIDLGALARNTREAHRLTSPGAKLCAVVKADGYGHGAAAIAGTLLSNGADMLAVATIDEGVELARACEHAGARAPIIVLGPTEEDEGRLAHALRHGLALTAHSLDAARRISAAAKAAPIPQGKPAAVHIKLDTGMGRIGIRCAADENGGGHKDGGVLKQAIDEALAIASLPGIFVEGIYTHFAAADEADPAYTQLQFMRFMRALGELEARGLRPPLRHCANSAATVNFPETHLDMVRAGIMLYGSLGTREAMAAARRPLRLEQAMSVKALVSQAKTVPAGACVSYGRRFIAARPTRVATLPLGYADGYRRLLSCGAGHALLGGAHAPVIGSVCMDMLMVDATDAAASVEAGDEAVLLGQQGGAAISADDMAESLGTISYEVFFLLGTCRLPKLYAKGQCS